MAGKRSKSSDRWLNRQKRDFFVRQAQENGQVSRAHFKLLQLDQKYKLLKKNANILELGAAPGGWTNYIEDRLSKGVLIAVDPLPITSGARTQVVEGMIGDAQTDREIATLIRETFSEERALDLVLSDMAPNMSGVRAVDQARSMELADLALNACRSWLTKGGALAIKAFQGEGLDDWVAARRHEFKKVALTKPKASRSESREVFVVAQGFYGFEAVDGML